MSPVWFITASSSGFGHEIATLALQRGHTVIATARKASSIQDLKDAGADTLSFDVTAPLKDIEAVAKDVFAKYGRIDYLINAAGYLLEGAVEECDPKEWYDLFNTNVFGTVNTIKAFLPYIRTQDLATDGVRGTIVTFGSVGSWHGGASFSSYAMTKWCMSALAESLADELSPFQITATVIEPGYFRTGFLKSGAQVLSKERLDAYEDPNTTTGKTREMLKAANGNQPGDVLKGAKVVVDVLTRTGVAEGKTVPARIPLGSDCERDIRAKIDRTLTILDEWQDVIRSTDYPEGQ